MNDRPLSSMIDQALRSMPAPGHRIAPDQVRALQELLMQLGIFARDLERTEALHARDPVRKRYERDGAAVRLYGRLQDPPHADNVVPIAPAGVGRLLVIDGGAA
ncbi:MAG: hypothetical protein LCH95_13980 [Proteobacteria bacterium]|nr:hypothetical protein [Pseudomonadota bacterium]